MFILGVIIANLYICCIVGTITTTTTSFYNSDNNEKLQVTKTTGNNSYGLKRNGEESGNELSSSYLPPIDPENLKSIYKNNFLYPIIANSKKTNNKHNKNQSTNYETRRTRRNEDLPDKSLLQQPNQQQEQSRTTTTIISTTTNLSKTENNILANRSDSDTINLLLKNDLPNTFSAQILNNNNNLLDQQSFGQKVEPNRNEGYINIDNNDLNENNDVLIKDDIEKIETHINNHNLMTNTMSLNGAGGRHYNTYHNHHHHNNNNNNHNNKYLFNSNSFGNNINLNYIHSLLTNNKPLLNTSPISLPSILNHASSSYGLSSSMSNVAGGSAFAGLAETNNFYSPNPMNFINQQQQQQSSSNHQKNLSNQQQSIYDQAQQLNQTNYADFLGPSMQQCGKQQVGYREPRIVGGNNTYEGEFPWAVSIQRHGNHHCGGVIVGKRWILTAAHCVRSQLVGNLLVRTGGHTLNRNTNSINSHLERDYFVDQIVMHGDFSRYDNLTASQMKSSANTNNADIALLRLRNDILWNEFAWPVCFPHKESGNFSGFDAIVIGWGKLNEKSEDFSNELQKVKLTIIDNKVCQNWFRQAGREMPIDDRIICAGFKNGGKDACHGDSGGPLLSKINGHYVVVGVVSTGIGCARPLLPGLYSRVSSYISWIEKFVNQ